MMRLLRLALAAAAVSLCAGCERRGDQNIQAPESASAPAPVPESSPPASAAVSSAAPPEPSAVDPEINDRYARQTDPKKWEATFEKEGREVHDRKQDIVQALELQPGAAIADVGAGTGLFTLPFARAVGPSGRVYAVDVQDYFLRHIADKARKAGLDNIELVQGDARSSKLPPASVDVAFMSDVYHHLAYPKTYLADLHQAIRPGGRLVVVDFVREEGRSEAWILEHVRASPDQFRAEIEAAGFTLARDLDLLQQNFFHIYARK